MKPVTTLTAFKQGAHASAYLGGWAYLALITIGELLLAESPETRLIQEILLLGVLVIVPLGLSVVPRDETDNSFAYRLALIFQPVGAVMVVLSFLLSEGYFSAVLVSGWLIVTGLIALVGLWRLRRMRSRSAEEIAVSAGLIFLPVGAVWLIMSRLGIQPFGFGDTIVLLTAVHFHFAGFAAPLLTGLAGRHLPSKRGIRRIFVFTVICVIAGTPLVAAGITVSPVVALLGAAIISLGLILLAVLVIGFVVPAIRGRQQQILLIISSFACAPAMVLACAYAYSIVFHKLIIDIPQMARTHGLANAFGFSLCGLIAWALLERAKEKSIQANPT